jgi:hypothetical protein
MATHLAPPALRGQVQQEISHIKRVESNQNTTQSDRKCPPQAQNGIKSNSRDRNIRCQPTKTKGSLCRLCAVSKLNVPEFLKFIGDKEISGFNWGLANEIFVAFISSGFNIS